MVKVKRGLLLAVIMLYGCFIFACKGAVEKSETTKLSETKRKLEIESESETLSSENVSNDETTVSKETDTTLKQADNTAKKTEETTTKKQEETTTKKVETTKPKETAKETTSKKPETTKPKETTTEKQEETTKKQQTANNEEATTVKLTGSDPTTTGSGRGSAITISSDEFTPSSTAKAKAKTVVSQIINSKMSDYECVKAIHDYLVKNVDYDYASIENGSITENDHPSHTAEGALCGKLAVCDGYAKAFELMCAEAGIYAYMMYGEGVHPDGSKESHAWNVVKINGQWYQIDCTWDDPIVNNEVVSDGSNLTYTYFLLTDSEMYKDHMLDKTYSKNFKVCDSSLFKGLGQKLSLELAMDYEGAVVSNVKSFYLMITEYATKSKTKFSLAIPIAEGNKVDANAFKDAVVKGVTASGFSGSYSYEYTSMSCGDYVVYNIEIKK